MKLPSCQPGSGTKDRGLSKRGFCRVQRHRQEDKGHTANLALREAHLRKRLGEALLLTVGAFLLTVKLLRLQSLKAPTRFPIVSKEAPIVSKKAKIVSQKAPTVSKKAKTVNCK